MKPITTRNWVLLIVALLLGLLGWQLLLDNFRDQERQLRTDLRNGLRQQFPEQAEAVQARYGLRSFPIDKPIQLDLPQVVLVHGLDDPGRVWMNLAPALSAEGFGVWIMSYPDDQPIEESARLLQRELVTLRDQGVERLDIVAHSMGGLVSRELLTGPGLAGGIPAVGQLIMVGTPNQGSELARFRALAELRDQFADMINGDFHWLGWVFDGAGEAGVDLIPGSRFLQQLNARPAAPATRMNVIAAVLGEVESSHLQSNLSILAGAEVELLNGPLQLLQGISETVGDGLVTLESARLAGAGFYRVEGNHLSMIRNLMESSERLPPAIPIVIKLLKDRP